MNREIKFRVFFYNGVDYITGVMYSMSEAFSENFIDIDCNRLIATDECSILMQYTGLKDKNGKEIYEGDIVVSYNICYKIEYLNAMFVAKNKEDCEQIGGVVVDNKINCEVIGNIYQNPELLEGLNEN